MTDTPTKRTYTTEELHSIFHILPAYISILKTLPNNTSDATITATEQYIQQYKQLHKISTDMSGKEYTIQQLQQQLKSLKQIEQYKLETMKMYNLDAEQNNDAMND